MARRLTTTDGMAIINAMADEMLGENATIQAVNTSTFVSVGENLISMGTENVMNSLSLICSRDLIAIRPYKAKFQLINALDSGMFANRVRKISYYAKDAVNTGAANTQVKTNFAMGYDNGTNGGNATESQYYQSTPVAYESNFAGGVEWQYPYTLYEDALKIAFRSPEAFADFLNGFLVACANDIETEKEAFSRLLVLNALAGTIDLTASMPGSVVNLTSEFNARFGTSYTTAQLMSTYFKDLLAFFVSRVKTISDRMEERSILYHFSPPKTIGGDSYVLPRQTKKEDQRMLMVSEFWNEAEAFVLPQIFNDQYLKLENFEKIEYWQNINDPTSIDITPAIIDVNDLNSQTAGAQVTLKKTSNQYVLGCLFDKDALMVDFHLESVSSSPMEGRKRYRTVWNTINKNPIWDPTENMIVFIMSD